jgi:hypothetical protein
MTADPHCIVLRLVGGDNEGAWWMVETPPAFYAFTREVGEVRVPLAPTGSIEWDGDRAAEVYVPEQLLGLWKAEHAVDR